jgi:phosphatidylserine/phosphatidylglycerophosphate/cardiolipin synthase-like enzyme
VIADIGVRGAAAARVSDDYYLDVVAALISRAGGRCLASVFLVDIDPEKDGQLRVDGVLRSLADAKRRGTDARLLIGGSRDVFDIALTAEAARSRALHHGVPCRWLQSRPVRGSHVKLVVADDEVLLGSHNWSTGGLGVQTQDSVRIRSLALASVLAVEFERQWARAEAS